jgi:hypothetical protein
MNTDYPDLYRMDTQEGMKAYEASFRMKIGLGERIPPTAERDSFWGELPESAI